MSYPEPDEVSNWVVIGGFILFFVAGIVAGTGVERISIRNDAIAHGAAHYTVNEKTGESHFTWVSPNATIEEQD